MKNLKNFSRRGLALFLSLVMCLSLLPGTARAIEGNGTNEDPYQVTVENGQSIIDALKTANIPGKSGDNWYYYYKMGIISSWPAVNASIGGLNRDEIDGSTYQINTQKNSTDAVYVQFEVLSEVLVNTSGKTVMMVHKYVDGIDQGVDWEAVERSILDSDAGIVTDNRDDKASALRVEYLGVDDIDWENVKSFLGSGNKTSVWQSLEDADWTGDTDETRAIRISWNGDATCVDCTKITEAANLIKIGTYAEKHKLTFVSREESTIAETAKNTIYMIDLLDETAPSQKVLNAVIDTEHSTMGLDKLTVTGELAEGTHEIAISYPGSETTQPASITVTVEFKDLRAESKIELTATPDENGVYTVSAPYKKDGSVDTGKVVAALTSLVQVTDESGSAIDSAVATVEHVGGDSYRISYAGNDTYKAVSTTITVNVVDGREEANITTSGISIVYDESVDVIKQAILNQALTGVPEGATIADFTFEYEATLELLPDSDISSLLGAIGDKIGQKEFKPLEGESYKVSIIGIGTVVGRYPQIGAGEHQVKVTFNGSDTHKAFGPVEFTLKVEKAPVELTVNSKVISVKDAPATGMVTATRNGIPINVGTITVYAGLNSGAKANVYLEMSKSDPIYSVIKGLLDKDGNGFKISDLMANQETLNKLLKAIGIEGTDIPQMILDAIAKTTDSELIKNIIGSDRVSGAIQDAVNGITGAIANADITIHFGVPTEAGVYGVAGFVSDDNYIANPNIALGYLVIKMEQTSVSVGTATIKVGEAIPADLINSNGAPYIAMYGGIEATSDLDATLYVEFSGFAPVEESTTEITIGQLRSILINRVGEENKPLEALLEKLNRTMPGDSATVKVGQPSTEHAGTYAVAAIAANAGTLPGVGVGSLTIIDKDMAVIAYVVAAEDSRIGTVRLNGNDVGGPVVYELVPGSATEALKGATAEVKNRDEHHFVKWTAIGLFQQPFYSDMATIYPSRPTGVLSSIPDWVKSLIPNFDRIPDLSKVAAIYVAHFEEHTWGDSIVTIEPTCTTEGVKTYTCTKDGCGATKTEPVAALGHDWDDGTVTTEPTCTTEGVKTYTCLRCGETKTEAIPAAGHEMVFVAGTAMNCVTDTPGTTGHWHCRVCDGNFKDQNGNAVWIEANEVIPVSHRVSTSSITPEVSATCLDEGTKAHWTCVDCGRHFADSGCTDELTDLKIAPLGHDWELVETTPSTCEDSGITEYRCNHCEATKRVTTIAAGHTWGEGVPVPAESVCGDTAAMQYTCTVCRATRIVAGTAAGHTLVLYETVEPTCTTAGHHGGSYCARCNAEIEPWTVDSAHHILAAHAAEESTCTAAGNEAYWTCDVCGKIFEDAEGTTEIGEIPVIPMKPHTPVSNEDAVAATCTATGLTASTRCEFCGTSLTGQEETPALGHDYSDIVTAPTCEDQGYTTHICSRGDSTTVDSYVSALGHSWDGGVVTVAPTETTPGVRTYTCTRDSRHTRTETITTLDHTHSYTAVVTAPTHTEQGYTTYTCACGESYVGDYVAAVGHTYTSTITVYPTAYSTGLRTYTCSCGATYTEVIPATGIVDEPTYPTYPGTGTGTGSGTGTGAGSGTGTGTTGSGTATITEPDVPLGETPDSLVDIGEDDVPLSMMPGRLNTMDHIAYIRGYQDGTVRPMNNITRAEVATIFYRLMTDAYRESSYATTHSFTDAPFTQWYNEAISTAANAGILKGYGDGTVRPDNNITRAEFVTIAASFLDGSGAGEVAFTDIHGHWAESDINRAAEAGWIKGDGDGKFRPNDSITRAEAVTIINRILGRATETAEMMDGMVTWPDSRESDWWYIAIQEATNGHDYESALPFEHWTALW